MKAGVINSTKSEKLKNFNLFQDLSDRELELVSNYFHEKEILPKTLFMAQGSDSENVYFIYKGLVRAYKSTQDGQEIGLSVLGPGEIIGEMGILENLPRSANVQTLQKTEVLILTKNDFIELLKSYPKTSITLLKFLSKRVRNVTDKIEGVMSKNIEERTLEALRILSKLFPNNEILLSHEELAIIVGATRARITEALDVLKNKEKLELHHRKIKLL